MKMKMKMKGLRLLVVGLTVLSAATAAHALPRSIANPSFEEVVTGTTVFSGQTPAPLPNTTFTTYSIASDDWFPGWFSTNGQVEMWVGGFQNRSASDGEHLVELNPSAPVGLYQDVCLVNGETLSWTFDHSARTSNKAPTNQTLVYEVVDGSDPANPIITQTLDTNTVTEMGSDNDQSLNAWETVTGFATYTGATGIQRLQFRSTAPDAQGNFLDNIQIDLVPLIVFSSTTTSAYEGASGPFPSFAISGKILSTVTVTVAVNPSSTATEGVDFTIANKTITIPPGTYDGVSPDSLFVVPFNVPTDSEDESDETVILEIASVTAANPSHTPVSVSSQIACDNSTTPTSIHTILEPSVDLSVNKTLLTTGSLAPGQTIEYTIEVKNLTSSTSAATNVAIEDLPTNLTNLNITSADTCPTGPVSAGVICTITSLAVGATETITIEATVP